MNLAVKWSLYGGNDVRAQEASELLETGRRAAISRPLAVTIL
jgi:hypothetical protein